MTRCTWWYFLSTEEGRDQTMAHALDPKANWSICGQAEVGHIGADGIEPEDEEYMEPEEFCPQCREILEKRKK